MSYILRECKKEDWEDIVRLSALHNLPFPSNILSAAVVVKDDKVVAFAYLRQNVEAIFLPDISSKKNIVISLELLQHEMQRLSKGEQIHVFSLNKGFTEILKKHFNYTDAIGDCLVFEDS